MHNERIMQTYHIIQFEIIDIDDVLMNEDDRCWYYFASRANIY